MNAPLGNSASKARLRRAPPPGLAPSLERKRLQAYIVQMLLDIAALLGASALAGWLYFNLIEERGDPPFLAAQLLLPLYLTLALHNGTYSLDSLTDWRKSSEKMIVALLTSAVLLAFIGFLGKFSAEISRVAFSLGLIISAVAMIALRAVAVRVLERLWGASPMNVLVIEDGGPPISLPHAYYVSAVEHDLWPTLEDPHTLDRLARYLRNMDQVIVSCRPETRADWAQVLKGSGTRGEVLSDLIQEVGALGVIRRGDVSSLLVSTGPLGMRARASKRLLDLGLSSIALLLLSPVFLAAALAVKLEDGGPVFFRQRRLGRGNEFFLIYKLRTMKVDRADADGNRSTEREDERITRVGKFLRRTSIDELPQLLNVLKGEMSRYEGFPMTLVESFASGLPALASRIGSLEEVVANKIAGAHCEPGDPDSLASAVRDLFSQPERLEAMGQAARRIYEKRYTQSCNLEMLEECYRTAIESAGVHSV